MIVYVSIGNSDDKLSQAEWSRFHKLTHLLFTNGLGPIGDGWGSESFDTPTIHGHWLSSPTDPWQNACWCLEFDDHNAPAMQFELKQLAAEFRQDCIAWAEVRDTEFLGP